MSILDEGLINRAPTDADIEDKTRNHKCSGCAHCCTAFLPWTSKEVHVVKDFMKEHFIVPYFLSSFDKHNLYVFCPFLNKDTRRCQIYPVRPLICRTFKCDKNINTLNKEKEFAHKRADYNSCGLSKHDKGMASTQMLFFNDVEFDIKYRHLVACNLGMDLCLEEEQSVMPMIADKYIKKGGE